jgi:NAD(P)-dependent dehydrogenase (short-subunit alcohol dehydrogenase family)
MDFNNLLFDGSSGYSPIQAYGRSKLANILFTYELQRCFEVKGIEAVALAVHPGASNTNLGTHLYNRWYFKPLVPHLDRIVQSAAMGALPSIRAAVDPGASGGQYYGPGGFREFGGYPVIVQSSAASHDLNDAKMLWNVSEELTNVKFTWN